MGWRQQTVSIISMMVVKSVKKQKKQKLICAATLIAPIVFSMCIIVLRTIPEVNTFDKNPDQPIEFKTWWRALIEKIDDRRSYMIKEDAKFQSNVFIPLTVIGFAPNQTVGIQNLMKAAMDQISMPLDKTRGYTNCEEMRTRTKLEHFIASICFHNIRDDINGLPLQLNYSIMMPSELRYYDDTWIGSSWSVSDLYTIYEASFMGGTNKSTITSYAREGFLSLQYSLSLQYLLLTKKLSQDLPEVILKPFSLKNTIDELINQEYDGPVLVMLIGLMFPVVLLTKDVVEERELSFHYALHRNTTTTVLQCLAWYFHGICMQIITCVVFVLVLWIDWSPGAGVLKKCPLHILLFFIISYAFSAVAFSIMLSSIIRTTRIVVTVVPIYWVVAPLPVLVGQTLETSITDVLYQVTTYFMCNITICRGLRRIWSLQNHVTHLTDVQHMRFSLIRHDPSMLMLITFFYIQTVIYLLLAILLDETLFPWSYQLLKCFPCRLLYLKIRDYIRNRKKTDKKPFLRDQSMDENRRFTALTLIADQVIKVLPHQIVQPKPQGEPFDREIPSDTISSTSESVDLLPSEVKKHKNVLDKQLVSWLSNTDIRSNASDKDNTSKSAFKIYTQVDNSDDSSESMSEEIASSTETEEDQGVAVIEFQKIWKKFSKIFVVRNFSLKIFQKELVVLLGHNAAGKTTLFNIACGLTVPSHGQTFINGYDVIKHSLLAFDQVGISMKTLRFHREFTFIEQLIYFARLRGLSLKQSASDARSFLKVLRAQDLANVSTGSLTNGQMRLLQVLCAFAGRTKVVLLDRPLEGVDVFNRQNFYNFVFQERPSRTILITTNFPEVATSLGDRIAILVNGRLYDCGKEHSLLKKNKNLYRLICYMGTQCNFRMLFNFFALHLPELQLESKSGDTAVFRINASKIEPLQDIIHMLNLNMNELHLDSFKLQTSSLEQVLLRATTHNYVKSSGLFSNPLPKLANRIRMIEETKRFTKMTRLIAAVSKIMRHIRVVVWKRLLIDIRRCALPICQIMVPSIFCFWSLLMPHLRYSRSPLPNVTMSVETLKSTIALVAQRGESEPVQRASKYYLEITEGQESTVELGPNTDPLDYILDRMYEMTVITDLRFSFAAIFTDETIKVMFNNNINNASPISLNMVMNALAVGFIDPKAAISVQLEILPFSTLHGNKISADFDSIAWTLSMLMCFSFCFVWALPLLDFGLSRDMAYNRLELISGMSFETLSIAYFVYGFLVIVASLIPLNAITFLYDRSMIESLYCNAIQVYIILVTAACVMSINVLSSYWLTELHVGYILIIALHSMGIVFRLCTLEAHTVAATDSQSAWHIMPFYSLLHNLIRLSATSDQLDICKDEETYKISVLLESCLREPNCCNHLQLSEMFWSFSWITHTTTFLIWAYIFVRFGLNFHKKTRPKHREDVKKHTDPDSFQNTLHYGQKSESDSTWIREKIRVHTVERPLVKVKPLHMENLAVFFRTRVVLKHINLLLDRFQILSVVGINGSGKTVLVKTILGAQAPSAGFIHSFGNQSNKYSEHDNYKLIGFCAQDDMIIEALTVVEYIQAMLIVRGLSKSTALEETMNLLRIFDLYSSRFLLLPKCSRGVLKRVSLAISLIGYAGLILLDDPFAFLDISSQLEMCCLIQSQCSHGQAVLFTSCDTKHCEVANRTGLLNRTNLCIIGDRQELQMTTFKEYIVVKARIRVENFPASNDVRKEVHLSEANRFRNMGEDSTYFQFCSIIEHFFPHAIVKTINNSAACFWLSKTVYTMSDVLLTLHQNKNIFYPFKIASPYLKTQLLNVVEESVRKLEIIGDEDI